MSGTAQTEGRNNDLGTTFLAVAAGGADVVAFLTLGHVFASAMTGNTALLGIALSRGDMAAASLPVTALAGFIIGAAIASLIYNPSQAVTRKQVILRSLLGLEIACLAGFALVWHFAGHPTDGAVLYGLILLCSVAMGIQGIAAKTINTSGVNTIVFTSTLVAIVLSMTEIALGRRDNPAVRAATRRQIAIFAAYAGGAILAGLLDWAAFVLLAWLPMTAAALALVFFELAHKPDNHERADEAS